MVKLATYNIKGTKKTSLNMPKGWEEKENDYLLAQAVRVYEANKHKGLSKVKSRGEVKGSTRKIYRQKGTGGARHGAKYAPIFVGGGIAHGPTGIKRQLNFPKKLRQKALNVALTSLAKDGKVVVVDGISTLKATKDTSLFLKKLSASQKEINSNVKFTFVLSEKNYVTAKFIRNLKNSKVVRAKELNAHTVYFGGILVIDHEVFGKRNTTTPANKPDVKKIPRKKDSKRSRK